MERGDFESPRVNSDELEIDVLQWTKSINEHSFSSSCLEAVSANEGLPPTATSDPTLLRLDSRPELPRLGGIGPRDHDVQADVADVGHAITFFTEGHLDLGRTTFHSSLPEVGVNHVEFGRTILDQDLGHNDLTVMNTSFGQGRKSDPVALASHLPITSRDSLYILSYYT